MACLAPELWDLLGLMLSADQNVRKMERAAPANSAGMDEKGDQMMRGVEDEEDALWDEVEDITMDDGDVVMNRGSYEHAHTLSTNAGFCISSIYLCIQFLIPFLLSYKKITICRCWAEFS